MICDDSVIYLLIETERMLFLKIEMSSGSSCDDVLLLFISFYFSHYDIVADLWGFSAMILKVKSLFILLGFF